MKRAAIVLAVVFASCATTTTRRVPQPPPSLQHALWGIDVEDDDGTVVYAKNADVLMIPASNRKLFAAATTAECLGFEHRFTTELLRDGDDLILRGGGDPSLGGRYYASPGDALAPLVAAVHGRGITRVRDVVADVSFYSDRITIPPSWKVGNLPADYSAPADALALHENAIEDASVPEPALHAAHALRDLLVLDGIDVTGEVRVETQARAAAEHVASVESPPLWQLFTTMLKNSHNLYAEMLFKDAGGGTYAGALDRERQFAQSIGIDAGSLHFVDGSGLSPEDLVTPAAVVKLLRWMNAPERRAPWWFLLAAPNEEGTLHRRLIELEPRLRGKTGTLEGVNALSGIIAMPDGRYRYFSVIVDHHTAGSAETSAAIDALVRAIASP